MPESVPGIFTRFIAIARPLEDLCKLTVQQWCSQVVESGIEFSTDRNVITAARHDIFIRLDIEPYINDVEWPSQASDTLTQLTSRANIAFRECIDRHRATTNTNVHDKDLPIATLGRGLKAFPLIQDVFLGLANNINRIIGW